MISKSEPPDEIELLLPWAATGRLNSQDLARVAEGLKI